MALFKNSYESHQHSLKILNALREYDTFLESLTVIADMGCGNGEAAEWFANLTTRDDDPEPLNYIVYAVDQNIKQLDPAVASLPNVKTIECDFETPPIPRKVDLIWSHDSFQYARNPLQTLKGWKSVMNENGMLVMAVPQTTYIDHNNRLVVTNHSNQYYSYNILNLIYMLAISGFDCRDAYFYREKGTPWLYAAVYASQHDPIDEHATWYDLAERQLINDSLINSVQKYGYARLEDLIVSWLDKDNYFIRD